MTEMADSFVGTLFGGVPAEDLTVYDRPSIERLAALAFEHLSKPRPPGRPDIRLVDVEPVRDGAPRQMTLLDVINDDGPYLLDSTLAELVGRGLEPKLVAHPILPVRRGLDGTLEGLGPDGATGRESLIHIHLDRLASEAERADLQAALEGIYADVAVVTKDAALMARRLGDLASEYRANPPPLAPGEVEEAVAFLQWLGSGRFELLGMRAYRIPDTDSPPEVLDGSGLGLLRDSSVEVLKRGRELVSITPEIRAFLERPKALLITKASAKSRVHRPVYLDYIGAKLYSGSGRLWGELAIVGLFTGTAYASPVADTPYLRGKAATIQTRANYDPDSFAGRTVAEILDGFPRDELFQLDDDTLFGFVGDILRLTEHPRIRVLVRPDPFDRFVSVIVYVPKDRYDTNVRRRIGEFLARTYGGRVSAAYPAYPDGPLARTHFIIGRDGDPTPAVPRETLERGVAAIVRTWPDRLADALGERFEGARARDLALRYASAFGADYREQFSAAETLPDIAHIERLTDVQPRAVDLYRREGDPPSRINLKLFSRGAATPLSQRVPILEQLGFRVAHERTFRVAIPGEDKAARVWLNDIALDRATGAPIDLDAVSARLEAALLAVFRGVTEADGFNKLVLEAGLGWREAALFRTFGRYLRQIVIPFAQDYLANVLAAHGDLAADLAGLFAALHDPHADEDGRAERVEGARAAVDAKLADVTSLDDDRILRRFLNLIDATRRTNFFQLGRDGLPVEIIAFKFECAAVDGLPKPRPLYEIFMNSPRVEALHLRFGHVARGGLRWSDRPQDFRTEVLGLVKAQQVKNAVIVPVGAKGGFFPKQLPPASDRAAWMAEGTEAYRIFIRTLLSITDNLKGDTVVPPPDTVRRDGDDPYLVVAADKGTATFSDVANAISVETGHWLGDAFASGGSNGYDHKAMGITARGAWEAVKRHFREMDVDIQADPVTVAGVGDMSGDVFGNGMLLSRTMKLVAAFDHRHIFLDPDPDPALAFLERERLFALPRSSWEDYERSLISEGGGIFPRSLKSIPLSPAVQAVLGFDKAAASPAEVMSAILRAPVGLLWFGGIGTYVRASGETDADAGDRANDAVRVVATELRAQVIGEGANLGMTQRARIEAAFGGVRLNTDAIDNSAGVNTSDVEVNIKVALATPEHDGRLAPEARNTLLATMTDAVAALVLRNNYLQTLALSLAERKGAGDLGFLGRLMSVLERAGRLDRALEFLPDERALRDRTRDGRGLTRPELAVLLAYAKLALHDELLASSVPDDPYLGRELERYFPPALTERFPDAISSHRLRREIIATQLANAIVNRGGPAIVTRLRDETGADAPVIAAAYAAARDCFDLSGLNGAIDALDGIVSGGTQLDLYGSVQDLTLSRMVWFIRNGDSRGRSLDEVVGTYRSGLDEVAANLFDTLPPETAAARAARIAALRERGVPEAVAERLATLETLGGAPDVVLVARRTGAPVADVARTYYAVDGLLGLGPLSAQAREVPATELYDRLARDRALGAIEAAHRSLAAEIVALGAGEAGLAAWQEKRGPDVERIRGTVSGIVGSGLTISKLTVAASLLGDLPAERS